MTDRSINPFFQLSHQTENITVFDAYLKFLQSLRQKQREDRTVKTYEQRLAHFVNLYGHSCLNAITEDDVDNWMDSYTNRSERYKSHPNRPPVKGKLSSSTIRGLVQSIKTFFNFCEMRYDDQLSWRRSPAAHLERPKKSSKRKRKNKACSPVAFKAMFEQAETPRDKAIMAFLADTAVRAGELVNLRIDDLKLAKLEATVDGKTGERDVDYTEATLQHINGWLAVRKSSHDFVFLSTRDEPFTVDGLYQLCRRLAERAGVKKNWNPQAIRRMVGQVWADAGVNPERIQLKLGHADIKTTLDWYTFQDKARVQITTKKLSLIE